MGSLIAALLGVLKLGKAGGTLISMAISLALYAQIFGWKYAAGFVLMIFLHEMGHFVAAKEAGLNVTAPTFIPFVGAWIELKDQPMSAQVEAYVGIAGPVAGTVAAIGAYMIGRETGSMLMLAVAYAGFMINLFNLVPMHPLDGGRITAAISPKIWILGVPMIGALFWITKNPLLLLIGLLGIPSLMKLWSERHEPVSAEYYKTATSTRLGYAIVYFSMIVFLIYMSGSVHDMLPKKGGLG